MLVYQRVSIENLGYTTEKQADQATTGPKNVLKNAEKQVNVYIYICKYRFIDPTVGALLDAFPSPHQDDSTQS